MPDRQFELSRLAELYDLENPPGPELDFYLTAVGPPRQRVLDLGCGTGTLACALAARGHHVTAVDAAAAMLTVARRKPHAEHIDWVHSPAQLFTSVRRFDWIIMTGHVLQVFLTDADLAAVFQTIRGHLHAGGRIAFETRNPAIAWAADWTARGRAEWQLPNNTIRRSFEIIADLGELIAFTWRYDFADAQLRSTSTLRFPSRHHIETLLDDAELQVCDLYGDWDRTPFDPARSHEMIFGAKPQ